MSEVCKLLIIVVVGLCCLKEESTTALRTSRRFRRALSWTPGTVITPDNRTLCPETPQNRPSNRVNTTERIAALRQAMANTALTGGAALDAYLVLITDEHGGEGSAEWDQRLKYITGFSGSAGYALITKNKAALWTDGRYFLQADNQMDCNWILMKEGQAGYPTGEQWLVSVLANNSRVGAYPNYVAITTWQSYETALSTQRWSSLVGVDKDLVDIIWTSNRPPRPNNPLFVHTIEFAGVSWKQKLSDVRQKLTEQKADALAVTILEESAWLFNLRGTDQTSSLFFAYSIVLPKNETRLFLNNYTGLINSNEIQQHLQIDSNGRCKAPGPDCINVFEYSDIIKQIQELAANGKSVWLDPTANYATYSAAGDKRQVLRSPIALMKAIKNTVERQKFAECIMRDSAALIEFLALLENEIAAGKNWTEVSVADKLEFVRSTYPNYKGLSFYTISAFGPHASIIHYRPDPSSQDTNSEITKDNVFLLDSGGQYLDGTTDVTRTMHYGTPKPIVKEAYTRVLMGSIDLAQTIWPEGLYGSDFDARARSPLWQNGWDYNHGTGHGIGYYLSVHEGPGRINMGFNAKWTPIYEGMFFSDEPGYYEDNDYGIRLETLVQVVEANTTYHFGDKKYLGFRMVALVPFEPNLINYDLLSPVQKQFLNTYNQRCLDEVGPYLRNIRKNETAYKWLQARVKPIPIDTISSKCFHSATPSLFLLVVVLAAMFGF